MNMIMPAEFEERMKEIEESTNVIVDRRIKGEELMKEVLISLGYEVGVKVFEGMMR